MIWRQVRAVENPELRNHTDMPVIVCSVQGTRRFADLLAGGRSNYKPESVSMPRY
jgi:hypothetical protein